MHAARHAMMCAERWGARDGAWLGVLGSFGSANGLGERTVVGWATAESSATGCGADHDRMTSVPSRSSSVSRWQHWIRAWGRGEPETNDPAA
jgi:hypothetical protein